MSVSVTTSPSEQGKRARRSTDDNMVAVKPTTVIKPCPRSPPTKRDTSLIPEDLSTSGNHAASHSRTVVAELQSPPSTGGGGGNGHGHDDRYPCLRRALQCGETPILPLGTYAVEFGFDVSCALPFLPTGRAASASANSLMQSPLLPTLQPFPPASGQHSPFGMLSGPHIGAISAMFMDTKNDARFQSNHIVQAHESHLCATTHSLCHLHRVAQQSSTFTSGATTPSFPDFGNSSLPCCSSSTQFINHSSATNGLLGQLHNNIDQNNFLPCNDKSSESSVVSLTSCPLTATTLRPPHVATSTHKIPSTQTSESTYNMCPSTELGPTSIEASEQLNQAALSESGNVQKRFKREPQQYVYAKVWKKDNRTWLWKKRDPTKQQCNLKTSDNKCLTTNWKKDNRSWLWKSSSKSKSLYFSQRSKSEDK